MNKKTTNGISKKLKWIGGSVLSGLLSLIFASGVKAELSAPLYGMIDPVPVYGMPAPTPGGMLSELLPFIGGVFLVFVIAPIVGLVWYHKRGGTKKWPGIVVWILGTLFVLSLIILIIFLITT